MVLKHSVLIVQQSFVPHLRRFIFLGRVPRTYVLGSIIPPYGLGINPPHFSPRLRVRGPQQARAPGTHDVRVMGWKPDVGLLGWVSPR
jgi:hypothetical protein